MEWTDASTMRQVPDNQEVFVHSRSQDSLILELVEQAAVKDDEAAPLCVPSILICHPFYITIYT